MFDGHYFIISPSHRMERRSIRQQLLADSSTIGMVLLKTCTLVSPSDWHRPSHTKSLSAGNFNPSKDAQLGPNRKMRDVHVPCSPATRLIARSLRYAKLDWFKIARRHERVARGFELCHRRQ